MLDDPESPTGRRSRLEDEVLEILYRSDRPPSFTDRLRATLRRWQGSPWTRPSTFVHFVSARADSGIWLAAIVVLGVAAFFVRNASPFLARGLAIFCLVVLLAAIVQSFRRPDRGTAKRWRGRDIDYSPPSRPLWLDRVMRGPRRPPRR
jgi:hypothetical protein